MHGDAVSMNPVQVEKDVPHHVGCRHLPLLYATPPRSLDSSTDDAEDESITRLRSPTRRSDNSGHHRHPPHPSTRENSSALPPLLIASPRSKGQTTAKTRCDFAPNLHDTSIARSLHTAIVSHTQLVH
ncbi:hypothetical protein HDV57DRAFT_369296 [Trichoderma longibrachiatum]|uniref:Uncharacterized protein n=1 Tax=Trichoderma longibrachiatum ATCC 18648 TaxID=983965 RepID=A0A2T4BXK9_TRILO|nr:hypothetical protein M440DRAFT_126782 [Trichoderma longibrachiatum ATCC 18648]